MKRITALFLCILMLAALVPFSAFADEASAAEPAVQAEAAPEKAPEPTKEEPKAEPEPTKEEPKAEPEPAPEPAKAEAEAANDGPAPEAMPAAEPEDDTPVTAADEPADEPAGDVPAENAEEPEAPEDEPETPAAEPEEDPVVNADEPEAAAEADPFAGDELPALLSEDEEQQYTLILLKCSRGYIYNENNTKKYVPGDEFEKGIDLKAGWRVDIYSYVYDDKNFKGWVCDPASPDGFKSIESSTAGQGAATFTMPAHDLTITATFADIPKVTTVTLAINPKGLPYVGYKAEDRPPVLVDDTYCTLDSYEWRYDGAVFTGTFEADKTYTMRATVKIREDKSEYIFTDSYCTAVVNGKSATRTVLDRKTLQITYDVTPAYVKTGGGTAFITLPSPGAHPDTNAGRHVGDHCTAAVSWFRADGVTPMDSSDTFDWDTDYVIKLTFTADTGYQFINEARCAIGTGTGVPIWLDAYLITAGYTQRSFAYTFHTPKRIDSVKCTVTVPAPGTHPDMAPKVPANVPYKVEIDHWLLDDAPSGYPLLGADSTFTAGTGYVLSVRFTPEDGYAFDPGTVCRINDVPASATCRSGRVDAETFLTCGPAAVITLSHDYLLMKAGEAAQLTASCEPALQIAWDSTDELIVRVDRNGVVQAANPGTAYVTASVTVGAATYTARCRIDVGPSESGALSGKISEIRLITASAAAEVYQTEGFAEVTVLPVYEPNLSALGIKENRGAALQSARFTDETVAGLFDLRVKDDRTLEVVPRDAAIEAARSGSKVLKGSYTSAITVTLSDRELKLTTDGKLKLTVKKSMPAVKAQAIAFNSVPKPNASPQTTQSLDTQDLVLDSSAAVAGVEVESIPEGFDYRTTGSGIRFILRRSDSGTYPAKGAIPVKVTLKGWSEPVRISVPFTVKAVEPKVVFSAKSATLLQGSADTVTVGYTVSPAKFVGCSLNAKIEVQNGKAYEPLADPDELTCSTEDGVLTLKAAKASADGLAHSYRITLNVGTNEKTFTFNVKTLAASALPKLTAKTSGSINTKVPGSHFDVTYNVKCAAQNLHPTYKYVKIRKIKNKTYISYDASDLFTVTQDGSRFSFALKEADSLEKGWTYQAVIDVDYNGDGNADTDLTPTLKITFAKTAPKVTISAKASGKLDLTRRDSKVILTPTVTNLYGDIQYEPVYYRKAGKVTETIAEADAPFTATWWNGSFTVRLKSDRSQETKDYSLAIKVRGTEYVSKAVSLPVKAGKVTVKANPASVMLYKADRFSSAVFTLPFTDGAVAPIERIVPDAASALIYRIDDLGSGVFALGYLNNELPAAFKNGTVKLTVYVEGCDKPAATVPLKVGCK